MLLLLLLIPSSLLFSILVTLDNSFNQFAKGNNISTIRQYISGTVTYTTNLNMVWEIIASDENKGQKESMV